MPRAHDAAWSEMPLELLGQVAMCLANPHTPGTEMVCQVSRHCESMPPEAAVHQQLKACAPKQQQHQSITCYT
jgi:hypothetical protein